MKDHIALVQAEVQERLRSVLVQDEDRRLLRLGRKRKSGVDAVV